MCTSELNDIISVLFSCAATFDCLFDAENNFLLFVHFSIKIIIINFFNLHIIPVTFQSLTLIQRYFLY